MPDPIIRGQRVQKFEQGRSMQRHPWVDLTSQLTGYQQVNRATILGENRVLKIEFTAA
jgi:hypothetical protein